MEARDIFSSQPWKEPSLPPPGWRTSCLHIQGDGERLPFKPLGLRAQEPVGRAMAPPRHSAALRWRRLYARRMSVAGREPGPACGPSCPYPRPGHFSQGRSQALLLPQHREDVQRCPEALGVLRGAVPCDPKHFLPPDDICPIANCGS